VLGLVEGPIHNLFMCVVSENGLEVGVLVGQMDNIVDLVGYGMSFGIGAGLV